MTVKNIDFDWIRTVFERHYPWSFGKFVKRSSLLIKGPPPPPQSKHTPYSVGDRNWCKTEAQFRWKDSLELSRGKMCIHTCTVQAQPHSNLCWSSQTLWSSQQPVKTTNLDFLPFQKRFVHDKRLEASAGRFARDIPRDTGKACSLPPQASAVVTVRMHIVTEGY